MCADGAEAVEAEALGVAGHPQRAVADQPRAQQRRGLEVAVAVGQRRSSSARRRRCARRSRRRCRRPVKRARTQRFSRPLRQYAALAARPAEPRDADPRAGLDARAVAGREHRADDLVAGDQRPPLDVELAVDDVQVGAADAARVDVDEHLAGSGPGSSSVARDAAGVPGASRTMARTGAIIYPRRMAAPTDIFDLGRLRLSSGEGRRLTLGVRLGDFDFGGERYEAEPPLGSDARRLAHDRRRLRAAPALRRGLTGPCMRCLEPAAPVTPSTSREVHQPGGGEELTSPYINGEDLDVGAWAHDAYALALPAQVLCTPRMRRAVPASAARTSTRRARAPPRPQPDPRWAKLRELRLD